MSTSDETWEAVKRAWANGETVQWKEPDNYATHRYGLWLDWADTKKIDRDLGEWRVKPTMVQWRLVIHRDPCAWGEAQLRTVDCDIGIADMLYVGPWVEVEMP